MEKTKKAKPAELKELKVDSLIELDEIRPSSNTEIWLVQWPFEHDKNSTVWPKLADFNGQEVTLKLNDDELGSIQSSTGKSYALRSLKSYTPEEVVFLSSTSDTKIGGKISRHVSLVHYPEPNELQKPDKDLERKLGMLSSTTSGSSRRTTTATPTQTIRSRPSSATPTTSSRKKGSSSIITGSLEPSKSKKRKHTSEVSGSRGHSDRDSERGHSGVTTSGGSHNQSEERKSKKKKNAN